VALRLRTTRLAQAFQRVGVARLLSTVAVMAAIAAVVSSTPIAAALHRASASIAGTAVRAPLVARRLVQRTMPCVCEVVASRGGLCS